jgi:iron(II)-dependent oxidoreductase
LTAGAGHSDAHTAQAWQRLQQAMALIPTGDVQLEPGSLDANANCPREVISVQAFYIDRFVVSNAEFAAFVESGVYDNVERWPSEVWQHVLQFIDRTGVPGPQNWSDGKPPRDKLNHPVTGICWYEAMAYAKWVGKHLPKAAQWQRSASWHTGQNGQSTALSYPWGNAFDASKANTWSSGSGGTVAVDQYYAGCTPNGVHQLIGNVWEWIDEPFVIPWNDNHLLGGYAEVRGGAFDTYFESQCRCQFRSGLPLLFRGNNTGFRCCIPLSELAMSHTAEGQS